jgi:uncharacterized protein involved in response to NO
VVHTSRPTRRLARLLDAPFRIGFFAAGVMLAASALWWLGWLLWAGHVAVLAWRGAASLPALPAAHALVLSLAFTPLFFAGFLFTAGPRWLGLPPVPARPLLVPVVLTLLGWCVALPGLASHALLACSGVGLVALGWSLACLRFAALVRASRADDRLHARLVLVAGAAGAVAMWAAAAALLVHGEALLRAIAQAALWCFSATVFIVASHRMLPFIDAPTKSAPHALWLLWKLLAAAWSEGLGGIATLALDGLRAPPAAFVALTLAQGALQAAAGAVLLALALRWPFAHGLKTRMVTMLFGGFTWLGIAFAFSGAARLAGALGAAPLGLAPRMLELAAIHALAIGHLGATLFAMTTRVAAAHSGRHVAADNVAWAMYWLVQAAAFARVSAALWPSATPAPMLAAAATWALACLLWAVRCGDWFLRPRIDGRPG